MQPPKKDSDPENPGNVRRLEKWLTSIIAGHPEAIHAYTFYEEIDRYLGPWGTSGYPIAYGKYYNIRFTTNPGLIRNIYARTWVGRTTVKLQEALRDFIVKAYKHHRLDPSHLNYWKPEQLKKRLRDEAFASHPAAYAQGGLAILALLARQEVPHAAWLRST
jgi:hypothetical protein